MVKNGFAEHKVSWRNTKPLQNEHKVSKGNTKHLQSEQSLLGECKTFIKQFFRRTQHNFCKTNLKLLEATQKFCKENTKLIREMRNICKGNEVSWGNAKPLLSKHNDFQVNAKLVREN